MKLTIEFDAAEAACIIAQLDRIPSLLDRFEAGLARREQLDAIERECHQLALENHRSYQAAAPVEAVTDPAPGHPELPLDELPQPRVPQPTAGLSPEAAKAIQAATDEAADPTRRDMPFPDGVVPPPLPEGKTRWIYRGNDLPDTGKFLVGDRCVRWLDDTVGEWKHTATFSIEGVHHIEAV